MVVLIVNKMLMIVGSDYGTHYFRYPPVWPRPTWYANADEDVMFRTFVEPGGDELAVDFGPSGLWHYDTETWNTISTGDSEGLLWYNNKVTADFASSGLYEWDGTWTRISTGNCEDMVDVNIND